MRIIRENYKITFVDFPTSYEIVEEENNAIDKKIHTCKPFENM